MLCLYNYFIVIQVIIKEGLNNTKKTFYNAIFIDAIIKSI